VGFNKASLSNGSLGISSVTLRERSGKLQIRKEEQSASAVLIWSSAA